MAAGVSAGINGAFGGYRQIYDWRRTRGGSRLPRIPPGAWSGPRWATSSIVANLACAAGRLPDRLQPTPEPARCFEKGAAAKRGFALTLGNVISNASTGRESLVEERRPFVDRHEGLHIWQSRSFGPIYQAVYVIWFAGGAAVGAAVWALKHEKPKLKKMVETAAYYDNPFEFWAYQHDGHWESNRAEPTLKWRRPRWLKKKPGAGAGAGTPEPPATAPGTDDRPGRRRADPGAPACLPAAAAAAQRDRLSAGGAGAIGPGVRRQTTHSPGSGPPGAGPSGAR